MTHPLKSSTELARSLCHSWATCFKLSLTPGIAISWPRNQFTPRRETGQTYVRLRLLRWDSLQLHLDTPRPLGSERNEAETEAQWKWSEWEHGIHEFVMDVLFTTTDAQRGHCQFKKHSRPVGTGLGQKGRGDRVAGGERTRCPRRLWVTVSGIV